MLFEVTQVITLSDHHSALTLLLDSKLCTGCKHCCPLTFFLGEKVQLFFQACTETKIIVRKNKQAWLLHCIFVFLGSLFCERFLWCCTSCASKLSLIEVWQMHNIYKAEKQQDTKSPSKLNQPKTSAVQVYSTCTSQIQMQLTLFTLT